MRILAGAALAIAFVSLVGSAASAHVTVQPNKAEQGARGRFVFRVPNESDTASTIKLDIQIPEEYAEAAAGLRMQPKVGWTIATEKSPLDPPIKGESRDITEYVSRITIEAQEGYKIGPDQFDEFGFTTGPLPKDKDQIAFKIIQGYDGPLADGTSEARWVEERVEGQEDPKRPEAIVKLSAPEAEGEGETEQASAAAATDTADDSDEAGTARTIGILALILGVAALAVAVLAFVRKPAAPAASSSAKSDS